MKKYFKAVWDSCMVQRNSENDRAVKRLIS